MVTTVLECECGFEAAAEDEQQLVEVVRRHAREQHGMTLSHDEALLLATRAAQLESPVSDRHRADGQQPKEER